ncbi:protein-methionine-sulfoxide reductase catalytic subunit MsrP [Helicobacter sp. 11S02596-1]|uniref:protein-methionine-sulfoxide reductase catalytic subunit MsrP n=1 Tax=Helicobacter sp. 11S02596-1 TaxID=1476194 RepID=UPI000BA689D3|nr:protein-methionine-sulfoxide reductase catalytic subunit MsrP [Helicobacter sp. 11S02596-1]PAF44034.1 mononuclear molybdenum enzyme YedY [Helicobacter sp. 11S02596-1]
MLLKIKKSYEISENLITPLEVYHHRRKFLKTIGVLGIGSVLGLPLLEAVENTPAANVVINQNTYPYQKNPNYSQQPLTPYAKASSYNNFYEFGMQKEDPYHRGKLLQTSPWSVVIDGEVQHPIKISLEDILKKMSLQERIYHFRCVEAWSMNIPWLGFELKDLIALSKPKGNAKFVLFETIKQDTMPAVKNPSLAGYIRFPYHEGLRLDEANHPLTMLAVGMYGKALPNQNGAPLRLVVPWKYGFKNIKSIVRITLVEKMPVSTWMGLDSSEYGFYANVNPNVAHPRWSQANERFIGEGFSFERVPTKMFNGYAEAVSALYAGMDLKTNY